MFVGSWVNGNLNASKAHYREDEVVPFRMVLEGMTPGSHTVTIEWDTLKGDKHAYDFIYNYNYTEKTANPCVGIAGCSIASGSYIAIPHDATVPAAYYSPGMPNSGSGHDGEMAMFGGTITGISTISHPGGTDDPARATVTFTMAPGATTAVLAWGGHVADHHDWGPGTAAADISGSPYHMRLIDLDGSGGNQDRSISSDAIFFPSTIKIIKDADPADGQDFAFTTTGGLTPATFDLDDDADPTLSNTQLYPPIVSTTKNTYSVTETGTPGWTLDDIQCSTVQAGSASVDDQTIDVASGKVTIPLDEGEDITCTYFNVAVAPKLTVIKHVINDNGGTKDAADFSITVDDPGTNPASFPGAESPGTEVTVDAGAYSVSEVTDSGYAASYSAGCTGTLSYGETATCTITNNDKAATLKVIKHVINDDGGTKVAADFPIQVSGGNASPSSFNGAESPGTAVTLDAGNFSVTETKDAGYADSYSGCSGTIANGETKTCTITNNDKPAKLTVIKNVVNDDGGTKDPDDFTMNVTGASPSPSSFPGASGAGTDVDIDAGNYSVDETGDEGYTATFSADCAGKIANGESKTCTVTNNDDQVTIEVDKQVSTTDGGPYVPGPVDVHVGETLYFEITVDNTGGAPVTLNYTDPKCDAGTQTGPTGDNAPTGILGTDEVWVFRCSHLVTAADAAAGSFENTACATATSSSGGTDQDCGSAGGNVLDPHIKVVKDGPATAYHGDQVTYTFTVTNTGNAPLSNVGVTDDKCGTATLDSKSNADGDNLLENPGSNGTSSEVWVFKCTMTIPAHAAGEANPLVNTATASGTDALGQTVTGTDQHSTTLLHPAIHIEKDGPATAEAGKDVGYSLTVTNPGDTAIVGQTLKVTDAKCAAPPALVAKTRGGGLDATPDTLDPGDTWIYGCSVATQIGQTSLTNVGNVCGNDVNGREVCDDDDATTALNQPTIDVLPEQVVSGASKLSGPASCVRKAFKVRVTGRQIASVKITIDGRAVKTFRNAKGTGKRFVLSVNPARYGKGIHRLVARVTYSAKSETRPRTLRMAFERCAKQAIQPEFTG